MGIDFALLEFASLAPSRLGATPSSRLSVPEKPIASLKKARYQGAKPVILPASVPLVRDAAHPATTEQLTYHVVPHSPVEPSPTSHFPARPADRTVADPCQINEQSFDD
jgi:hypothetical protein